MKKKMKIKCKKCGIKYKNNKYPLTPETFLEFCPRCGKCEVKSIYKRAE